MTPISNRVNMKRKNEFILSGFCTCHPLSIDKYNLQFRFQCNLSKNYWDNCLDTREWFFDWPNWNRLGPFYQDCLFMGQLSRLADQTKYEFIQNENIKINGENTDGNGNDPDWNGKTGGDLIGEKENSSSISTTISFSHFWVQCDFCYTLTHHKTFKSEMGLCVECESHLKMKSSDRLELLVDVNTWHSFDEEMVSIDPIEFDFEEGLGFTFKNDPLDLNLEEDELNVDRVDLHFFESSYFPSEEDELELDLDSLDFDCEKDNFDFNSLNFPFEENELDSEEDQFVLDFDPEEDKFELYSEEENKSYKDRLDSYQKEAGLPDAIQTGIGQLKSLSIAIGVMDFQFIGGSMGSVVGEKITRLIEHATNNFLPLIILCASGGARMQEGGLSLMQMGKISSVLNKYFLTTKNKNLFYISILTTPTTGGVTASFGMLGDIVIAEPDAYIAFAGKRVIEETLNVEVPEGLQETEYLFEKGSFDLVVPRNLLKGVLIELYSFHDLLPFN
uniref:acetyl-CoA carboxylase carboxyltransferase beta subunit n=1 Tax=Centrolepis aristata TaxID=357897 RepID=UPI001F1463D1|nr:acetyl-CoA carboxylase carboxyltransferase beta subunit [Centrolepis aristata]ULQ64474.1 acetyl-CoA carboxylase carboxyltransferase beta subunit [Centrolepis aristata]